MSIARKASRFGPASRRRRLVILSIIAFPVAVACCAATCQRSPVARIRPDNTLRQPRAIESAPPGAIPSGSIDCVGVLHVPVLRGYAFANVQRLGDAASSLRTTARIQDLDPQDLRSLCDWESCVRSNGYGH